MSFMSKLFLTLLLCCNVAIAKDGYVNLFGANNDIDSGTLPEDVWHSGGAYSFPAAAAATTIVSDSTSDDVGGTGAITVQVTGLNSSYAEIIETATLDGTTPVSLTKQFFRINNVKVLTVGSGGVNAGNISVKHSSTVIGYVPASDGQSNSLVYTTRVPMKMWGWRAGTTTASTSGTFQVQFKESGGSWRTITEMGAAQAAGPSVVQFKQPIYIPKHADIRVRVTAISADNTAVKAGIELEPLE